MSDMSAMVTGVGHTNLYAEEMRVFGAMGVTPEQARGAVCLSLGRSTTDIDIKRATQALIFAWHQCAN